MCLAYRPRHLWQVEEVLKRGQQVSVSRLDLCCLFCSSLNDTHKRNGLLSLIDGCSFPQVDVEISHVDAERGRIALNLLLSDQRMCCLQVCLSWCFWG